VQQAIHTWEWLGMECQNLMRVIGLPILFFLFFFFVKLGFELRALRMQN
jgi:hypothetical protein